VFSQGFGCGSYYGTSELRACWSAQGKENVTKALLARFSGKSVKITELKAESTEDQEFREIMALFPVF